MKQVLRTVLFILIICILSTGMSKTGYSRDTDINFSIISGWKTEGSHELLEKKATAIKQSKTPRGLAISFGSLLGHTKIVDNDNGLQFLRSSYQAGIDYVIPAAGEFIFGVNTFKILVEFSGVPEFISANIVDENTRKTIVEPFAMCDDSGLRICIIGLSDMNIIMDSEDENVMGLDVISFDEALNSISVDVARENPDMVIAAGRMDRKAIMDMVMKYPFIDAYITNNQSGGFADIKGTTTVIYLSGRPIYIASEQGDHLSQLTVRDIDGIELWEFTDIVIGDEVPPDEKLSVQFSEILKELKRKEYEESITVKTGKEVASILREIFDVDVVLLERQSLYYYPLEDSLTLYNLQKIIKPSERILPYSLNGKLLKSAWEVSNSQTDPVLRLHYAGISDDGKVDAIPIQNDRDYTVLTSTFLRRGGNGYEEFVKGKGETLTDVEILSVVESFLVAKDERLREAAKEKLWSLSLGLDIGSNLNKIDVNTEKSLYGEDIPKPFIKINDEFTANIAILSKNNIITFKDNRHDIFIKLKLQYVRAGFKAENGNIIYKKTSDSIELNNKYTYHINYKLDPFVDLNFDSEFYPEFESQKYKMHPLIVRVGSGVTRSFKALWELDFNLGLHGTRNYTTPKFEDTFGTYGRMSLNKSFSEKSLIKNLSSDTAITWSPIKEYHMAFFLINKNDLSIRLWKNFNISVTAESYVYRSTKLKSRKVAVGFVYFMFLTYGVNWNL